MLENQTLSVGDQQMKKMTNVKHQKKSKANSDNKL